MNRCTAILNLLPLRNRCLLFLNYDRNARALLGNGAAATNFATRIAPFARAVSRRGVEISSLSSPPTDFSGSFARQGVDWLLGQSLNCTLAPKVSRGLERGLVITQARISARCYDAPLDGKLECASARNLRRVAFPDTRKSRPRRNFNCIAIHGAFAYPQTNTETRIQD